MVEKKKPKPWYPIWKGSSYQYDFRIEGTRYRGSTFIRDKKALKIAAEYCEQLYYAYYKRALATCPTFEEAAYSYIQRFGEAKRLEPIIAYFGPFTLIDEICTFEEARCAAALKKETWHPKTLRREVETPLKAVLSEARGLRPKKQEDTGRKRWLTPEEVERLIRVAQRPEETAGVTDPDRALLTILMFMVGTGATPGEAGLVRASDVNHATREVWLPAGEVGGRKTIYRQRMVKVPTRAWALIGDLPVSGRVFRKPSGAHMLPNGKNGHADLARQVKRLMVAAKINKSPNEAETSADKIEDAVMYTLRHTWATWFSAQVSDHHKLHDRGGWKRSDTARHYRKQAPEDLSDRLYAHGWDFVS